MPDQRSAMKEYRLLDQKRLAQGLSPDEEARYARLRDLVGAEAAPAGGGFDVTAAAARLRESLLPAGLRNRPPPEPSPEPAALEPELEPAPALAAADVNEDALAAAWQDAPFAPIEGAGAAEDPYFDPASLGGEGADVAGAGEAAWTAGAEQAWDPNAQPYDPNAAQAYDPSAAQAYDPDAAQAYDPNAAQAYYDPNAAAAYDPNSEQGFDPGAAGYDPNAVPAFDPGAELGFDPGAAPYDPNAAAAFDPNAQPYDPNAAQGWDDPNAATAFDPGAELGFDPGAPPYDPNAAAAFDPNAQPYDPNAAQGWDDPHAAAALDPDAALGFDPNAAAYDPNAAAAFDPNALPYDPNAAQAFDPNAEPIDLGAPDAAQGWDPSAQPYDPNAPQAWDAGWEAGAAAGEPGLGPEALAGALEAGHDPSAEPVPALDASTLPPLALGDYDDPDAAPLAPEAAEADLDLGLGELPFDPAAAAAVEVADLSEPPPEGAPALGDYDDLSAFDRAAAPADDLPADGPGFRAAGAVRGPAAAWQPDTALDAGFRLESTGSFELPAGEAAPGEEQPLDLGEAAELTELTDVELAEVVEEQPAPEPVSFEPEPEPASPEAAAFDAAPASPEPVSFEPEPEPASPEAVSFEPEPEPASPEATPASFDAAALAPLEAPTIEGEEILEELPPEDAAPPQPLDFEPLAEPAKAAEPPAPPAPSASPAPAPAPPAPAPAPAPAPSASQVEGVHRVVVHTLDGQVKRGVLEAPDLAAAVLGLAPQPGGSAEVIGTDKVKAIFFMLAPGEKAPSPEGSRVRVTFRDGRQVAGFSPDYSEGTVGFFMVPADTRTNTGRIWVYRSAVRQVSVS